MTWCWRHHYRRPQQFHGSNRRIQVCRICRPPPMMEHGLRAGCSTSTVEIESGRYGMCATGRGLHIHGGHELGQLGCGCSMAKPAKTFHLHPCFSSIFLIHHSLPCWEFPRIGFHLSGIQLLILAFHPLCLQVVFRNLSVFCLRIPSAPQCVSASILAV